MNPAHVFLIITDRGVTLTVRREREREGGGDLMRHMMRFPDTLKLNYNLCIYTNAFVCLETTLQISSNKI